MRWQRRRSACSGRPGRSRGKVSHLDSRVATAVGERKLLVGGEWVETGEWIDVRSPYSEHIVGRVPKAGAAEAKQAIDAAEQAMAEPLPAHKRAEISSASRATSASGTTRWRRRSAPRPGNR